MFSCAQNASVSTANFCWMVPNNYSETVKYDEKQQTKNQRVSILQTRFIYVDYTRPGLSCSTSRMSQSTNMQNQGRQYNTTIKSKPYSVRRVRTFSIK